MSRLLERSVAGVFLMLTSLVAKIELLRCYECALCADNFVPTVINVVYTCPTACGKITMLSENGTFYATKRFCERKSSWNNCTYVTSLPNWNNATDSCELCHSDFCNGPPCTFGAFCNKTVPVRSRNGENNKEDDSSPIQKTAQTPMTDLGAWKIVCGVAVVIIILAVIAIACNCGSGRIRRRG